MKRKTSPLLLLGILSVFTLAQTATIINPALNSLSEYYSGLSYSTILLLSTVVSLAVIPCSLLAGGLAGQKISYKALSILSTILILVGGMLPFLTMPSFPIVFFCRILVGAGIGFSSPIANALVMRLIPSEKQALWQGIGMAVMNVAGVLYQNLSGIVCMADLRYIWLVHGLLLLPLVLIILFLKEPEETSSSFKNDSSKEHIHSAKASRNSLQPQKTAAFLPFSVILTCAAFGLMFLMMYPFLLNVSSILVQEELGTSADAGVILSAYSIGGMAAGFLFGAADRILKKHLMPVSLLMQAAGMILSCFAANRLGLFLAAILVGIAIHWIWPACIMTFSTLAGKQAVLASGLFVSCLNLGSFLSAPFIGFLEQITGSSNPRTPLTVGMAGTVVIAVIWMFLSYRKQQTSQISSQKF